jgi:hypothetical protein
MKPFDLSPWCNLRLGWVLLYLSVGNVVVSQDGWGASVITKDATHRQLGIINPAKDQPPNKASPDFLPECLLEQSSMGNLAGNSSCVRDLLTVDSSESVPTMAYYYVRFDQQFWNRVMLDQPSHTHYVSDDRKVMEKHISWAKDMGIDGFIVGWKGATLDRRLELLMEVAAQEEFKLWIIYQGLDFERNPLPVDRIVSDLSFFLRRYADHKAFGMYDLPVVIWSGTWMFSSQDIQYVTDIYQDWLYLLSTERNIEDYQRVATFFDGNAYYWASVSLDTFPNYQEKLNQRGKAIHEHGGLWVAPDPPGFNARLVGGLNIKQKDDPNSSDQPYFFVGLNDDWEIQLLVYQSHQDAAFEPSEGIRFSFPNSSTEQYSFSENKASYRDGDPLQIDKALGKSLNLQAMSGLDVATLMTLAVLLAVGLFFYDPPLWQARLPANYALAVGGTASAFANEATVFTATSATRVDERQVLFGVQLLEPLLASQLSVIAPPIAKKLRMKPERLKLYLSAQPGLITKPLPLAKALFLSRVLGLYGVRTQVVVVDHPQNIQAVSDDFFETPLTSNVFKDQLL